MGTDEAQTTPEPGQDAPARSAGDDRRDVYMTIAAWVLGAAVLVFAAFFAWSVWADRQAELASTPAGRLVLDFEQRVRQNPNDANLRARFGEVLAAAGMTDQAIQQFNEALKADKENIGALLDLGIIQMQRQEFRSAEGYFLRVVDLTNAAEFQGIDLRREQAFFYLGESALTDKRYEEAISYFKAALRIKKDASDTYLRLALAYNGIGQAQLAEEQLRIALDFDPNLAQAHYELGKILLAAGDEVQAALHLGRAAQLAPNNDQAVEAVEQLGPAQRRMDEARKLLAAGKLDEAVVEARIAYALDPEDFDAAVLTAEALEQAGDTAQALSIYREAATLASGEQTVGAEIARLTAPKKK